MQNKEQKKEEEEPITLIMNYEQKIQNYKCYLNHSLETYILHFAKLYNINHSLIYILYASNSFFGLAFKKHISEIITGPDKKEKIMTLLIYIDTEMNKTDFDEIRIILAIEFIEPTNNNVMIETKATPIVFNIHFLLYGVHNIEDIIAHIIRHPIWLRFPPNKKESNSSSAANIQSGNRTIITKLRYTTTEKSKQIEYNSVFH